jgi:hypothetical protein
MTQNLIAMHVYPPCHAARCVAWAVLDTVLEEEDGALVEVKQHTNTTTSINSVSFIAVTLAVAEGTSTAGGHEPQPSVQLRLA